MSKDRQQGSKAVSKREQEVACGVQESVNAGRDSSSSCLMPHASRLRTDARGVSLMELLTVLAIIVILVAMGLVEFGRMDNRAVRNGAIVSSKGLAMAMKMYKQEKGAYTCALDDLMPYINLTNLRNSFLTVAVETDDCATFNPFTYLRLSAFVKGINPSYIVKYHVYPNKEPDCSADNAATEYPCTEKW